MRQDVSEESWRRNPNWPGRLLRYMADVHRHVAVFPIRLKRNRDAITPATDNASVVNRNEVVGMCNQQGREETDERVILATPLVIWWRRRSYHGRGESLGIGHVLGS